MSTGNRAKRSGINADIEKKREAQYDANAEVKARGWIEDTLAEELEEDFFAALQDGSVLCRLLNTLQEGLVPQKHCKPASQPFKQLENIGKFIEGCKKYGMSEKDLFVTLDLHEKRDKNMVVATIFALGRAAQKNGYVGRVIGPKEAEANRREFTEEDLREGRNTIGLQMGTNQVANQKGMTPYGLGRQIADTRTT